MFSVLFSINFHFALLLPFPCQLLIPLFMYASHSWLQFLGIMLVELEIMLDQET